MQNGGDTEFNGLYDPKAKARRRRVLGWRRALTAERLALGVCGGLLLAIVIGRSVVQRPPSALNADSTAQGGAAAGAASQAAAAAAGAAPPPPAVPAAAAAATLVAPLARADVGGRLAAAMERRAERAMRIVPIFRGPGQIEMFPQFGNAPRLLLATHGRLLWYRPDTGDVHVLHEGEGVYHGAFPGDDRDLMAAPASLWAVSRPSDWHPPATREWLLHLAMESGKELGRVALPSRFTHDAVRRRDKVYIANTGEGRVAQLRFPGLELERELPLFSPQEHINTLAPTADGKLWVLQHNLGPSTLSLVDLQAGAIERRIEGVGTKAHGLVAWEDGLLVLDSEGGALIRVDPQTGAVQRLWQAPPAPRAFLKGLCVVDGVAFFGVNPWAEAAARAGPALSAEIAAYDLREGLLLWRRRLPTRGLLNAVAAPHLAVESTAYALGTSTQVGYRHTADYAAALAAARGGQQQGEGQGVGGGGDAGGEQQAAAAQQRRAQLEQGGQQQQQEQGGQQQGGQGTGAGAAPGALLRWALSEAEALPPGDPLAAYPLRLDPVRWSSGLPRLDKRAAAAGPAAPGLQLLLLRADVAALRDAVLALPEAEWSEEVQRQRNVLVEGRQATLAQFKPGTQSIPLVFSDTQGDSVYRFPYYARFAPLVEPLLLQVLGPRDVGNLMRLQLARMPPPGEIRRHVDAGGYASRGHRIHFVLATNPAARFWACPQPPGQQRADAEVSAAAARRGRPSGEQQQREREREGASSTQQQIEDAAPGQQQQQQQQRQQQQGGGGVPIAAAGCVALRTAEGLVFELNNRLGHLVSNGGPSPRIHLIADVAEEPRAQTPLAPGQACRFVKGRVRCEAPAPGARRPRGAADSPG